MDLWHGLAIAAVALCAFEMFVPTFFALPAGVGFGVAAVFAYFDEDLQGTLVVLAVSLVVTYAIMYLLVLPGVRARRVAKSNAEAMAGQAATVTEAVDPQTGVGEVKLYGDRWRTIAKRPFDVGDRVRIVATRGNRVVIRSLDSDEANASGGRK